MTEETIPYDTSCEAEYEDGYILSETALDDVNPFTNEGNTFTAILNKLAEPDHGRMVRFSVFWQDHRYDIDWTALPENARPIRFRHGFSSIDSTTGEIVASGFSGVDFGLQWNDEAGENKQEIRELR